MKSHHTISLAVGAGAVIGGCLAAVFMYTFVVRKEIVTVAVPTNMTFSRPADHAMPGTAILHGKLRRMTGNPSSRVIAFTLSDWLLGKDVFAQLAIEDGNCTLEAVEQVWCGQAIALTRDTQKELTLPLIEKPLIKVWARTPDGLQVKRDENGKPTQVEVTPDDLKKLLDTDQLTGIPFIIMTSGQEIVSLVELYGA